MYINDKTKGGALYAMAVKSVRNGKTVSKEKPLYLGRVLDKENNIFKSRERGVFTYDINLSKQAKKQNFHMPLS